MKSKFFAPFFAVAITVQPQSEMPRLLKQMDSNGDQKITVEDRPSKGTGSSFWLEDSKKKKYEVSGIFFLSNLLQELKLASDRGPKGQPVAIQSERIFENPVHRVSRSIREMYWDHLTRRVDESSLAQALVDSKLPRSETRYLYVPARDVQAFEYFQSVAARRPELKVQVKKLPSPFQQKDWDELRDKHGLLSLALETGKDGKLQGVPFVVPGGRFNEMYGWDSYFESLGLLIDDRVDLAKAMVDNFVYQIENYGKILNANRTYYLNRSQPPFLTSMISAVYARMPRTADSREWLARSLRAAIQEYHQVWMSPDRQTDTGLSRYHGSWTGIPPEVEKGHFDSVLAPVAKKHKISLATLQQRFNSGQLKDAGLEAFFEQDLAVRESGHDTTSRWRVDGVDRAADFVTADLNSLLYKAEIDFARIIQREFGGKFILADGKSLSLSGDWRERANRRKDTIRRLLWDPEKKQFFDYNFVNKKRSDFVSATAFYPLWAQHRDDPATRILSDEEAKAMTKTLLPFLEQAGGVASTSEESVRRVGDSKKPRQWDYPNGWAPHQMLIWEGLENYGLHTEAARLSYKWLYTITKNAADYNGTVPEKFDVVKRSHAVFAEYGNVGTEFSYITQEGFGWMNASYQVGLSRLSKEHRSSLESLIPPEWLF